MLEIACNKCKNCANDECKIYGADANIAVNNCALDNFKNYTGNKISYMGVKMAVVSETPNLTVSVGKNV